jgi:hypothetical protein
LVNQALEVFELSDGSIELEIYDIPAGAQPSVGSSSCIHGRHSPALTLAALRTRSRSDAK